MEKKTEAFFPPMYLMYVDESGDPGLHNSPTRYFFLSGLVVHELRWHSFLKEHIDFRRDLKKRFGLGLDEEIHACHLLAQPRDLQRIPKHQRLEILRLYADFLAGMRDLSLITVFVDKQGKPPNYDVFYQAWQALTQRFENTITYRNFPGPRSDDERGMLFPDSTNPRKLRMMLRKMRTYNPVKNQTQFGPGYRNLQLRNIIEEANFRDSKDSYCVQSADVCAYLMFQALSPSGYMRRKSGHQYFKRLAPIFCTYASSQNAYGVVRL